MDESIKTAEAKDKILKYIIEKAKHTTVYDVKNDVFPDESNDVLELVFKQIGRFNNIIEMTFSDHVGTVLIPNDLTKIFLEEGGFVRKAKEDLAEKIKTEEAKNIELEKSKIDLELAKKMLKEYPYTKWMSRVAFIIALALAVFELYKFLIKIN